MEYVELLKDMWSSISNYFNYHKILNENLTTLREKRKRLECREQDINTELENAQYSRRKKKKKEVENWLMEMQTVKYRAQQIEQEAGETRYFSRLSFQSEVEAWMEKVDEMLELGNFPNGILIDVHQDEGNALLTAQLIGETTAERIFEKIWTCLEKTEVQSIGVWGIGGIGKTTVVTHIHNRLLENKDTFGHVYWVTVSKESSICRLQDAIARKINLDLSKEEDEKIRAAFLFEALQKERKFVLIFDDVWEVYAPWEVGIPIGVGVKLIITTRSRDVCLRMGSKEIIKVEPLSKEEAWELFNRTLDRYNALSQKEEEIAKSIIKECGGLPLAIVTTARSLSVVYNIGGWRNALNELREHVKGHTIDMENDVFKIMEFSYYRLNDKKLQECLLYCALFPEDFEIRRVSLIRYWIVEGLVEEMGSRQAERDKGHAILDKLENVCLLERCRNGKCVKMHDVIRDMAINITRKNSRFMVKTERILKDFPSEIEWSNNLERVSFIDSQFSTSMLVPNCPKLSTLFLQSPYNLDEGLSDSFFVHMVSLRVLDLSFTKIAFLPDSIYDLVNLRALILYHCRSLKHVGSLAKLKKLREFELSWNQLETIPDGMDKLVLLKHFNWISFRSRRALPNPLPNPLSNLLPNLVHLQYLIFEDRRLLDIGVEELSGLIKLEILSVNFSSLHNFNSYMRTQHYQGLTHYRVQLNGRGHSRLLELQRNPHGFCKEVKVWEYKPKEGGKDNDDYHLVLPTNVQIFHIKKCHLSTGLLDVSPSLKNAIDLKICSISECGGIEYLWWVKDCIASLNTLYLQELPSLRVLFKLRAIDIVSCSGLKHLYINKCHNLKHLFTPELVKYHLQKLQTIYVHSCNQMEDIIVAAAEVEEDINEMNNDLILCFPNLRGLLLVNLPKLKSIWKGTMSCDSLQLLVVYCCPKLRRLPLSVHITDGDGEGRASTPPLQRIHGEKGWWDGVEWDAHPYAKSVFQPLFRLQDREMAFSSLRDLCMTEFEDILEQLDYTTQWKKFPPSL